MKQLSLRIRIVSSERTAAKDILDLLLQDFTVSASQLKDLKPSTNFRNDIVIFDVEDGKDTDIAAIQAWLGGLASRSNIIVFITSDEGRRTLLQKGLLAGSNCVRRPLTEDNLVKLVQVLGHARMVELDRKAEEFRHRLEIQFADQAPAVLIGENILDDVLGSFSEGEIASIQSISEKSGILVDTLSETGIDRWMNCVRTHHSATYQHCLLVTGTIVAFGKHFRMSNSDLKRLAVGGLMHDLGKSEIPLSILDKPSSLSPAEMEIMQTHPTAGVQRASQMQGMTGDLVQLIGDHHEYLDGSGYPKGLTSGQISDPVRLLTIADIFAALVEKRSYKPQMQAAEALTIMRRMTGRIDMSFLKAVEPLMMQVTP